MERAGESHAETKPMRRAAATACLDRLIENLEGDARRLHLDHGDVRLRVLPPLLVGDRRREVAQLARGGELGAKLGHALDDLCLHLAVGLAHI